MRYRLLSFLLGWFFIAAPGLAQAQTTANEPIEITANDVLEWNRTENVFTARGEARAVQGSFSVSAATLKALYNNSGQSNFNIHTLLAEDDVRLSSEETVIKGDRAEYNVKKELAIVTGESVIMEAPGQKVTAEDRFEYWAAEGRVEAIGNPVIEQRAEDGSLNRIEADGFTAFIEENAAGEQALKTIEAKGNVVITTPDETLRGTYAIYDAQTNEARMTGGVTITRGPNILQGEKAFVDLNTNISRLIGSGTPDGRVKGVFFPGSAPSGNPE